MLSPLIQDEQDVLTLIEFNYWNVATAERGISVCTELPNGHSRHHWKLTRQIKLFAYKAELEYPVQILYKRSIPQNTVQLVLLFSTWVCR